VFSDIESLKNKDKLTALVSLNLSSVFYTVNHSRLLILLESKFLVKDTALRSFTSYLKDIKICVKIGSNLSTPADLQYGIPQGSILGSILFVLYISNIFDKVKFYDLCVYFYGDHAQLYIGFNAATRKSIVIYF